MATPINDHLAGKTIDFVATNGAELVISVQNGLEIRIGWEDGGPVFKGTDVRIIIPATGANGRAQSLGG